MNTLSIDLRGLGRGLHRFEFAPKARDLDLDPDVFRDLAVSAEVEVGDEVVVDVGASATARLVCSRTNAEFDQDVSDTLTLLAVDTGSLEADSAIGDPAIGDPAIGDSSADELDLVGIDGEVIDLAIPVRDIILLSVPVRPVAPEAIDLELPTSYGADRGDTVDPRWAALERLRSRPGDGSTPGGTASQNTSR